ncbi:MAG: transcriptional regulator NrdR [bacterium]
MICPKCKSADLSVIDSRDVDDKSVRRRRECIGCAMRFTTYERIEPAKLMVLKRSGEIEPFDRDKVLKGIKIASNHRIKDEEVEKIVDEIEQKFIESGENIIPTRKVGNLVINKLKKKDEISYIRFASVYKDFQDIDSFEEELEKLKK